MHNKIYKYFLQKKIKTKLAGNMNFLVVECELSEKERRKDINTYKERGRERKLEWKI